MPKGSKELTKSRKEEIINACEFLYKTKSFKDITIKEIGSITSFTRTSIYNYFETKEEIFLALFEREYKYWISDLKNIFEKYEILDNDQLADKLANSLQDRKQLLKLLSMNLYDMEANSRIELLTSFKVSFGNSMKMFAKILEKFCKHMTSQDIQDFIYIFFPFIYGIYPYSIVTDKQKEAMKNANLNFFYQTIYEISYKCLIKLFTIYNK